MIIDKSLLISCKEFTISTSQTFFGCDNDDDDDDDGNCFSLSFTLKSDCIASFISAFVPVPVL